MTTREWSANASETVMSVVTDWTPWIVAAAPAVSIGYSLYKHQSPGPLVFFVSLAVELAGVLAGHTLTEAREFNTAQPDNRRKLWPIRVALLAYVVVGCCLSVLLDREEVVKWWPVLLPTLAVMVYWVNGERVVIRHLRQPVPIATPTTDNAAYHDIMGQLAQVAETLEKVDSRLDTLEHNYTNLDGDLSLLVEQQHNPPAIDNIVDDTPTDLDSISRLLLSVIRQEPDGLSKRQAALKAGVNTETARQRINGLADMGLVSVNGKVRAL